MSPWLCSGARRRMASTPVTSMRLMGSADGHRWDPAAGPARRRRGAPARWRRRNRLRVHAQRQHLGAMGGKLPQVAVAQATIAVQTHFDDARVQALEQKWLRFIKIPTQHAPVQARARWLKRQAKGGQANDRLDARMRHGCLWCVADQVGRRSPPPQPVPIAARGRAPA